MVEDIRRIAHVNSPGGILENTHTTAWICIAASLLLTLSILMLIYCGCVNAGVYEDDKPRQQGKVEQKAAGPVTPLYR